MTASETCWDLLVRAADGEEESRERFSRTYRGLICDFLSARWRGAELAQETDDAAQEVLLECLRVGGALDRALESARGGFRPYLYGVVRNVARRHEERRGQRRDRPGSKELASGQVPPDEEDAGRAFDRAWARALVHEARGVLEARSDDAPARRRLELLHLRFFDGLPIRDIAARWKEDAARVHHDYARARQEFHAALREVVGFHSPGGATHVEEELAGLIADLA